VSIAFALYGLDSDSANTYMGYIRRQLHEGDSEAKSTAAMSLGIIGSNADIPSLQKLIIEGDIMASGSAASALGMLHSSESRAALEEMAQSANLDVQKKTVIQQVLNSSVWNQQK
jgi:HEAT repeat protein